MDSRNNVSALTGMGFDLDRANKALLAAGGDIPRALEYLLSGNRKSSRTAEKKAGPSESTPLPTTTIESEDEEIDPGPLCVCTEEHLDHDMIQCATCSRWFHYECVNITNSSIPTGEWHCHFEASPTSAPIDRAGSKFNDLESRALYLSVKKFSPIGKDFWSSVSTHLKTEFNIARSSNSCKLDWLRNGSAIWGFDERVSKQLGEEEVEKRKKLWRSIDEAKKPNSLGWRAIGMNKSKQKKRDVVDLESEDDLPVVKKPKFTCSNVTVPKPRALAKVKKSSSKSRKEDVVAQQDLKTYSDPTPSLDLRPDSVPDNRPLVPAEWWQPPPPPPVLCDDRVLEIIENYPLTHRDPEPVAVKSMHLQLAEHRKWVDDTLAGRSVNPMEWYLAYTDCRHELLWW